MEDEQTAHVEPFDANHIKTEEEDDLRYWVDTLRVTRHQLINAIQQVGTSIPAVKTFLATGRTQPEHAAPSDLKNS